MFDTKSQQQTDLTTPDAVARSQRIYDRIESGECEDAIAELNAAHGTDERD
ncbi:hypothetical protein GL263_19865 [Streptomyces durbertensis]|uniref:Uncharacterized protein n=1 Tax=Streptomyces durbertensis TaxID=2448886 RepID=A0ABR6EKC7_9ACTN|nr:hypothetical protein [Streptomyces durbertensis]MBB1245794.1 hypothetical protein [Streptomyces durbertensis]